MTKTPSEELLEALQRHREKAMQPPPEPPEAQWEDDGGQPLPEPQEGAEG